jgi:hypothetical protein
LRAIKHAELGKALRNLFVPKQRTTGYVTDKQSIADLEIFAPSTEARWAIKYDGINVQMIRVGSYVYLLTAMGMVLHVVLPACLFGEWPDGESLRAELTLSRASDDNYTTWQNTIAYFMKSLKWTDVKKMGVKTPSFSRLDETEEWEDTGSNRVVRLHVFGLGTRDNRIPDATIGKMLGRAPSNVTAVVWNLATSPAELIRILWQQWRQGKEGLIVRSACTLVEDFGSRPSSPDAAADAAGETPGQIVRFAKCKVVYPGTAVVLNIEKNYMGRHIHTVRLQQGRHIDETKAKVGLGHTSSWKVGDTVPLYVIPKSHRSNDVRWFVGLKEAKPEPEPESEPEPEPEPESEPEPEPESEPEPEPQRAAKRPRSDSEGPEPAEAVRTLGFCLFCSEDVAADSEHGRDGDQAFHMACQPAVPQPARVLEIRGVCAVCKLNVYVNCPRVDLSGYKHVRCTPVKPNKVVTNCGCGRCAGT